MSENPNIHMEQIIDMGLPLDQTRKLLGEFWATLNTNAKKTEFSEKVNKWFKINNAGLIELYCKEQDASPQPYFTRISRIKE